MNKTIYTISTHEDGMSPIDKERKKIAEFIVYAFDHSMVVQDVIDEIIKGTYINYIDSRWREES